MRFCWYLQLRGSSFCLHKTMPAASHNQWHTSSCALDFQNISSRFYKTCRTFTIRASLFPALYYITSCIRGIYQIIFLCEYTSINITFVVNLLVILIFEGDYVVCQTWERRCQNQGELGIYETTINPATKVERLVVYQFFQFFNHCKILKVTNISKVPWIALWCIIFWVVFYMFFL